MNMKNKIFLSGEWTVFSIRKTSLDPLKFDFQLILADDGGDGGEHVCFFRNADALQVDDLRLTGHLSLEIKRATHIWPEEMRFEVTDIGSDSLDFRCMAVEINGVAL